MREGTSRVYSPPESFIQKHQKTQRLCPYLHHWPLAYFTASKWLQNYAYHADIGIWIFVLSTVMTLIIALIPISYHAIKAALTNPVVSLRYE